MSTESRRQELADRLARGDFESLRSYLAAGYFTAEPGPGEAPAHDRIADLALAFQSGLPDLTATLSDITDTEDGMFTATMTLRGRHTEELWGVPPSGETIEWTAPITVRSVGDRFAFRVDDTSGPQRVGLLRQLRLVNPADEMDLPPHFPVVLDEFLLKLVFTGQAGDRPCSHLDLIKVVDPPTAVCERCVERGDIWPALRMCLICGFVGCCDTSKNRHMPEHYQETGHPIFRSIRNDEGWVWCYEDDAFFEKALLDRYR